MFHPLTLAGPVLVLLYLMGKLRYHLYLVTMWPCEKNGRSQMVCDLNPVQKGLSPIYTAEKFRHGSGKSGMRTQTNTTD